MDEQRIAIMLRLVWESRRRERAGVDSELQPWLDMLPSASALRTSPDAPPLMWTEREREALAGTPLHRATGGGRGAWRV